MALQITEKRIFYLDSGNQLTSTNNTFSASLQIDDSVQYDKITVLQANIPLSYYMVQDGFNTFGLIEQGFPEVEITLPAGNYNINSFSVAVQALLIANSPNGLQYQVYYPDAYTQNNTGKITFATNLSTSVSFRFYNKLSELFGFPNPSTNAFTLVIPGRQLVSTDVVKFVPEDTLFIHSNLVGEYTDVLQEIYNQNSAPLTNLTYLAYDPLSYSKKLASNKLRSATFALTDENGVPIYLNGLNMTLTVMLYREPNFYAIATRYMKYLLSRDLEEAGVTELPPIPERPDLEIPNPEEQKVENPIDQTREVSKGVPLQEIPPVQGPKIIRLDTAPDTTQPQNGPKIVKL